MYLHKQKKKDGDLYLSIKEKYHVPKLGSRERTVESLGYLSKLKTEYDDPIAYFDAYAKKLTAQKKVEKMKTLTIDMAETLEIDECDARNLEYGILKRIYREKVQNPTRTQKIFKILKFFSNQPVNPKIRHIQKRRNSLISLGCADFTSKLEI